MHAMLKTSVDICCLSGIISWFHSTLRVEHRTTIKHVMIYLKCTKDYADFPWRWVISIGYSGAEFLSELDD